MRRMLVTADLLGLALAFGIAMLVFGSDPSATDGFSPIAELSLFVATLPGWVLLAQLHGLYDRDEERAAHSTVDDLIDIVKLVTVGSWLFFLGTWVTSVATPYPPKLFTFWLVAVGVMVAFRLAARGYLRRQPGYVQNTIVVGGGGIGRLLAQKLVSRSEHGIDVLGYVDAEGEDRAEEAGSVPFLGGLEALPQLVSELGVDRVVVAFPQASRTQIVDLVRALRALEVQVDLVPRLFELVAPSADIHAVEGLPLIGLPPVRLPRTALAVKRAADIVAAALALLLLAPAFAWIAARIKLDSPGPIFYRHERVGLGGRPFRLIKFRTMYLEDCLGPEYGGQAAADEFQRLLEDPAVREEFARTYKLGDDPRVTRFGRLLRRLSLDELPQLVNVLRGDMSLVGPRPVTVAELERYGQDVEALLTFRPGATGYWQVNGRSQTLYDDRVRLDLAYIHGWSLKLDLLILGKTFWVLLTGHGAY